MQAVSDNQVYLDDRKWKNKYIFLCWGCFISLSEQEISPNYEQTFMTFGGEICVGPKNNSLSLHLYLDLKFSLYLLK